MWSLSYSTSMQACSNGRCKNPSSEKQGEKEPYSDFGFCTHLLWLGKRGPGKGCWILAMMSFFHSCLRVVQPHPGLVEECQLWRLWFIGLNTGLQKVAKSFLGFTCCPDKWFSSPQSKGVIMDGQLARAGWCPQPACGTTLFFHKCFRSQVQNNKLPLSYNCLISSSCPSSLQGSIKLSISAAPIQVSTICYMPEEPQIFRTFQRIEFPKLVQLKGREVHFFDNSPLLQGTPLNGAKSLNK